MGTFSCCQRISEDTSSVFAPGEKEIYFPDYKSTTDKYFALIEGKYNLMKNIQLLEYMNLLEHFSIQTATIHFDGKYRSDFSSKDRFLSIVLHQDEFQSFIENKLLNTNDILNIFGEDERTLAMFKDLFTKIFSSLNVKLNSYYNSNKEDKITKRNLVGLGLLFCRGQNISKVKLFFDLFKDDNEHFVKSDDLNNYLIGLFLISSYCLLSVRTTFNCPELNLPKIGNNLAHDLLNGYGFTQKDSENLLEYFNTNFFDKEQLTWDEFKSKFGNNKQSFSWIFSSKGIRNKLEDKTLFKKDT
jgi:hypothetical protein